MTTNNIEYELTYLAKRLPVGIKRWPHKKLVDVYVAKQQGTHPRLRLRREGDSYELTKKVPLDDANASAHVETTIPLSAEEFGLLVASVISRRVEKIRYTGRISGRKAEVDVFEGELKGLVLIDFEFESKDELEKFSKPAECLADVTQEPFVAGGLLAGRTYEDISNELKRFGYGKI